MRLTGDFLRGRGREVLSRDDKEALEAAVGEVRAIPARTVVTRRGQPVRECMLLLEGSMCRYMDARDGFRQLLAYHVPGDFVDLHGFALKRLDHDVATISPSRVATVPREVIGDILRNRAALAQQLWRSTLLDASMNREWIFRLGRLDAVERIAHFLCETHARMAAVGRATQGKFALPLTQQDIGEACGLTAVHVNRTLRRLREDGLATVDRGEAHIHDLPRLARVGEFHPDYLYLDTGSWANTLDEAAA